MAGMGGTARTAKGLQRHHKRHCWSRVLFLHPRCDQQTVQVCVVATGADSGRGGPRGGGALHDSHCLEFRSGRRSLRRRGWRPLPRCLCELHPVAALWQWRRRHVPQPRRQRRGGWHRRRRGRRQHGQRWTHCRIATTEKNEKDKIMCVNSMKLRLSTTGKAARQHDADRQPACHRPRAPAKPTPPCPRGGTMNHSTAVLDERTSSICSAVFQEPPSSWARLTATIR